jgi:GNAT superfamily N-acetyltransferase
VIRSKIWAADLSPLDARRSAATLVEDFVEITAGRLPDIAAAMGPDGDRAAGRFARGSRCFAIEEGGSIVAFGWLSTGQEWIGELSLWFTPEDGEGYVWNCYTLEPHRRRGKYRRLLNGLVLQAGAIGLNRLWIGSIDDPAEKADADAGFSPVLLCEVRKLAGVRMVRLRPAPGAHPGLVQAAHQRLNLQASRTIGRARGRIH